MNLHYWPLALWFFLAFECSFVLWVTCTRGRLNRYGYPVMTWRELWLVLTDRQLPRARVVRGGGS